MTNKKPKLAEEVLTSIFAEEVLITDAIKREEQSSGDMKFYYHGFREGVQACQIELMLRLKAVYEDRALKKIIDNEELYLKFLEIEKRLTKLAKSDDYICINVENEL